MSLSPQVQHTLTGAILLGFVQQVPPKNLDEWMANLHTLRNMNRFTSIHILGHFPAPFHIEKPTDPEAQSLLAQLQDFYRGIATYLLSDVTGIKLDSIEKSHWKDYKKFAQLSRFRYQLIDALFDKNLVNERNVFGSPSLMWLLAESSVCRQMLTEAGFIQELSREIWTKESHYNSVKKYVDLLYIPVEPIDSRSITSIEDAITKFDRIIDFKAYEIASIDQSFDRMYYQPYMAARKQWNSEIRRNKNLKIVTFDELPKIRKPNSQNMGKLRKKRKHKEM